MTGRGDHSPASRSEPRTRRGTFWLALVALFVLATVAVIVLWRESSDPVPATAKAPPQRAVEPKVISLLEAVQGHLGARRFEEGLAAVDEFLENHGEDAGVFYARGLLNIGTLNYQAAIEALERAVELDPRHPDAHHRLGIAYSRIGALDEANSALERALDLRPDFVEARLLLGRNLARKGNYETARASFLAIAESRPADSRYELGLLARQENDLEEAEALFRQALAADPKHLGATSNLGQTLKLRGETEAGNRFLERHVQLEEERYEYDRLRELTMNERAEVSDFIRLAVYELGTGKVENAAENFRKALEMEPENPRATYGLGRTYLELGELSQADELLSRAQTLDPENSRAFFFLGLIRHMQGRFDEARQALDRSRELEPWRAQELLFLGNALFQTGAVTDARLAYEQSIAKDPELPDTRIKLALLHYLDGGLEDARDQLERLLELQPEETDTMMFLGIVTFRLDDRSAAREAFSAAAEAHSLTLPGDEQTDKMLERYRSLPESEEALDFYRQIRPTNAD